MQSFFFFMGSPSIVILANSKLEIIFDSSLLATLIKPEGSMLILSSSNLIIFSYLLSELSFIHSKKYLLLNSTFSKVFLMQYH